jgi:hypothetical protein
MKKGLHKVWENLMEHEKGLALSLVGLVQHEKGLALRHECT